MDDYTPLLGQVTGHIPPSESDMFLQVVESPWTFISGRSLFLIRISLAIAMTSILAVYLMLEIIVGNGGIFAFRLMNLAWAQQCIYMWLTSYWTYLSAISEESCHHPYAVLCHRHMSYSTNGSFFTAHSIFLGCLFRMSSFPTEHNVWCFYIFHTFYTVTMVVPFASTLLYFVLLHPSGHPVIPLEVILNTFNVGAALTELLFLNSVTVSSSRRDQRRMVAQTVHLVLLAVSYCKIWVWIGNGIVNGPGKELDWRLFGGGWKSVNVVGEVYVGWWTLEWVKGQILAWRKKREVLTATGNGSSRETGWPVG